MAFAHVHALLFGVERCHARQHAPLHPASGGVFGRLRYGYEWNAVLAFHALKLHVVKQVARGAVHLVEQKSV